MSKLKELEKLLTEGKITRRNFIGRVSAMGLMAAVSPGFLSGKAAAATPQRGGRAILGSAGGATTDSMDPGTLTQTMSQTINQCIRGMLVEVDHPSAGKIKMVGIPVKYSETNAAIQRPPPLLGEHSDEILSELLDYDRSKRDDLKEKGII